MLASDSSQEKIIIPVEKNVIRKKVTEKDEERCEVALLSSNIEPKSKPTDLFEKLEEKRKIRHENALKQLAISLNDVNIETEKNITISSVEVKAHFKHFDDKLKDIIRNIDKPEVASYCGSVFLEIQNKANEFKREQEKLVEELYQDLIKFENERAKKNEKLLHLACEEIRKIGYFLPYEVQIFVENETLKMNELSLNNRRCYEDLKLTLTLLTEQTFKSFMDNVFCIQEKWVQFRLHEAFVNLQNEAQKNICQIVPEVYARLELKGQELIVNLSPDNLYSTCKAEQWSRNVEEVLVAIDNHGKNLIDVYKRTLNAVFHGFDNEVEEIKNELNFIETLTIQERIIKPILFEVQNDQTKEIDDLEMIWQETLSDIRSHLKELTQFLLDAGKLWDRHTERLCESKKLILKALEKSDKNNQAFYQDMEIKLNIGLDGLRQEHIQNKLEKAYEAVVAMLNSLKTKYESAYIEDVGTVEDYYKMMTLEADVLSAELKEFIYETHPMDHSRNMLHYHHEKYKSLPEGKPIFKEIQMCIQQIQTVRTWKQGVWTAMDALSEKTRESLEPRAECWVKKKIESMAEKVSIQMELLEKRMERVKIEMYEKRVEEVTLHQNTLEKHKKVTKHSLSQMKENLKVLVANESDKVNSIKENLVIVETNAKVEDRPGVIRGNQLMMERKKEEVESEIKLTFDRFRAHCETLTFDLRQSNISYMKSIKFFHENGDYSTEEGKMFMTSLEAIDKEINTDLKSIIKDSTKEENDFIKKVSLLFVPSISLMNSLFDEALFNYEIRERVENLKTEIRDLAKTVKVNLDFLLTQANSLYNFVTNPEEPVSKMEDKHWTSVFQLFYRNVCNLFYPVVYLETAGSSVAEEEKGEYGECEPASISPCCCAEKFSLHISISKTATFRTTEKAESFTCKDYKNKLFNTENPPENNGTFMAVISNALWAEMDFLQKSACVFYKKLQGRKIIKEDLIPINYETFAEEILAKLKYYNVQVEQFWLQMILGFLPVVECLKSTVNKFFERKLEEYENLAMKSLKDYENNFKMCLECQTCENLKELDILDRKLLPLHGFPNNVNLLNELEEEVVRKTANQKMKWEAAIKRMKAQVKCFRFLHIKELCEIKSIQLFHEKVRNRIFIDEFGENLIETINEYCNRGGYCTDRGSGESSKPKRTGSESQEKGSGEVPSEHKLNFEDIMSESFQGIQTYLKQLKKIVERERLGNDPPPECSPCGKEYFVSGEEGESECLKYCEPKINILLDIIDLEQPVGNLLERLKEYTRSMKSFADDQKNIREEALLKWLTVWKFNVKKVMKLYSVKYEEKPEVVEEVVQPASENNKPKTEKTSASVTSTLPRLCPTTKLDLKDTSCNIPKLKSRSRESRSVSNESQKRPGSISQSRINLLKSRLTESIKSNQVGFASNASLILLSPKDYHGHIPILYRHSLNHLRMSPPVTRSPSPIKKVSPKEKSWSKVKTITLDSDTKKKTKTVSPRSPSPVKKYQSGYIKTKSRTSTSPTVGPGRNSEKTVRRVDSTKQTTSPRINSPSKRKSKSKIVSSSNVDLFPAGKPGKGTQISTVDANSVVLKQSSQPSLCIKEKIIQPQEKISLDHLKNEVYTGDHRRLSFEKVQLRIEKSLENSKMAESKRSFFVTYSSENIQQQEEISLSFLQKSTNIALPSEEKKTESKAAIRTLSGQELILTPSMKLDLEKDEITDNIEISELLHETGEHFDDQKEVHIPQDDANEYDSEMSTDGEDVAADKTTFPATSDVHQRQNSLWKSREADLLNDVDYRQSVYHPAVSRRPKEDDSDVDFKSKAKPISDNFDFEETTTELIVRSRSTNLKNKYSPQGFNTNKMDSSNTDRSWVSGFDKVDERQIYNSVLDDVPYYDIKRMRTKKERVSGALLHLTLKVIRLLAIFNLWPGDNCHMLTSQSLRFAR